MNTHLVPGDETHPPTRTEERETPTLASHNMFAAIGLAYQLKKKTIWAIDYSTDNDNTYKVADLRTRAGRDHEKIVDGSKIAILSAATHLAHITGCLTHTNYITPDPETPTPIFKLVDSMWKDSPDGLPVKGPPNNFKKRRGGGRVKKSFFYRIK